MAARRYQRRGIGTPLQLILAFSLLKQQGPIRLPGKLLSQGKTLTCCADGDELVETGDGDYYCQKCGQQYLIDARK